MLHVVTSYKLNKCQCFINNLYNLMQKGLIWIFAGILNGQVYIRIQSKCEFLRFLNALNFHWQLILFVINLGWFFCFLVLKCLTNHVVIYIYICLTQPFEQNFKDKALLTFFTVWLNYDKFKKCRFIPKTYLILY